MEKITVTGYGLPVTEEPDNLTVIKRLKYNARYIAYYASNYGAILNHQYKGKMSVIGRQKNRSKKESPCSIRHGQDKRPNDLINSSHSPLHNKKASRLVAEAFLGEDVIKGKQVHHINNNPACNRADNLKAVTHKEHMQLHKQIRSGQIKITNLQKSKFYVTQ